MHGLTVRWSLEGTRPDTLHRLREYVRDRSYPRLAGMEGLRFKTWRAREGEWFEGCYVFASPAARDRFQTDFEQHAATSPATDIVGAAPILVEPCDIVAVVEGGEGFLAAPAYDPKA